MRRRRKYEGRKEGTTLDDEGATQRKKERTNGVEKAREKKLLYQEGKKIRYKDNKNE